MHFFLCVCVCLACCTAMARNTYITHTHRLRAMSQGVQSSYPGAATLCKHKSNQVRAVHRLTYTHTYTRALSVLNNFPSYKCTNTQIDASRHRIIKTLPAHWTLFTHWMTRLLPYAHRRAQFIYKRPILCASNHIIYYFSTWNMKSECADVAPELTCQPAVYETGTKRTLCLPFRDAISPSGGRRCTCGQHICTLLNINSKCTHLMAEWPHHRRLCEPTSGYNNKKLLWL